MGGKKYEVRGKQPQTTDTFARSARQRAELFFLFTGPDHKQERLGAIDVLHRIREAPPDVSPLHFPITCWDAMTYRYVSAVMGGIRRLRRMIPDNARELNIDAKRRHLARPFGRCGDFLPTGYRVADRLLAIDCHSQNGGGNPEVCAEGWATWSG